MCLLQIYRTQYAGITSLTYLQESGKQGSGLSTYVIAQAQARFADAFGLEMKVVELVPDKMAGKSEAELRGDNVDSNC